MEKNIKMILCPIDFSNYSANSLQTGAHMAHILNCELSIVHIVSKPWSEEYGDKVEEVLKSDKSVKVVENMVKEFSDKHVKNIPYNMHVAKTFDHTYTGIIEFADEIKADLIVMSTHGRTGAKRFLMGSVAENVVRRANCSVYIVR